MNQAEWVKEFADLTGVEAPSEAEVDEILGLAGVAAHASERTSAPIASWMAGRSGRPVAEMVEAAKRVGGQGG